MTNNFKVKGLVLAMGMTFSSTPVFAADDDAATDDNAEIMVIVGSRAAPRSIGDSPVPVDVISAEDLMANGTSDMTSLLAQAAPSFNVGAQPISDAATMVRPANLRGLSPDSTLVLVNGKRRHRSAVIAFLGGGIADGAQGPDIAVIPAIALKQVEILRDGASAQYGSDAIAGVINFVLKDNSDGGVLEVKAGQYSAGDGDQLTVAGNMGMPLTERGFVNFSFEFNEQDATDRSVQRDDATAFIAAGNTDIRQPHAQVWGSPEIKDDMKLFLNVGLELDNNSEAYMFGNWAERTVDGGFFFRNPNTRAGVFGGPGVDDGAGLDGDGDPILTPTILTADLTPGATSNAACPIVRIASNGIPDQVALDSLAAANCFSFIERFPGGFTPNFGGDVTDVSLTMGTKGEYAGGTSYDFSASVGQNQADFRIRNTVNGNLGPLTPTAFKPGSYVQLEKSANADFSKDLETGMSSMTMSYGVEFREESFEIINGDSASFANTLGSDVDLANQGFSIGSNGFQGFNPRIAGVFSRRSKGAYFDLETYVSDTFMVDFAARFEDFSDFGSTFDWKLSTKFDITEDLSIRGSVSTGFRAPTIGQSSVQNVSTSFSPEGGLQEVATVPPTSDAGILLGGKALEPEESESYTLGAVYESGDFFMTIDYFNIDVDGRISQTSDIALDDAQRAELVAGGNPDALNLSAVRYFTNDFNTSTRGLDLVANYSQEFGSGELKYSFTYNWTDTEVTSSGENVGEGKIVQLEKNLPNNRGALGITYSQDDWRLVTRANYYGSFTELHLDSLGLRIDAGNSILIDSEFSYDFNDSVTLSLGANNLLDEYPDENPFQGGWGAKYPTTSPFGFNGRFVYGKASYKF
ncbi:MAG: iron complex outermembrane receptor protein [Polaribacter sp.]|jgi:iron complex outermembrane receptor protein